MGESQLPKSKSVIADTKESTTLSNKTAKILNVEATGQPNDYIFAVTISSPDTGCDRYADWWEVVTPQGELLYRRVLLHSHVKEQPFERQGGKVKIQPEQKVIVRMHMFPDGYSAMAHQGSVDSGFTPKTLPDDFAPSLAFQEPLPKSCAF